MFPDKIYKIGEILGLSKEDMDIFLSAKQNSATPVRFSLPVEVYKGIIEYGTVSIKDFKRG